MIHLEVSFSESADWCFSSPAKLLLNAGFLVYTALVVPVQLSFWRDEDVCDPFPTLYFDVIIDTFFLVWSNNSGFLLMCNALYEDYLFILNLMRIMLFVM
jgi:hypothetical protein